MADTQTPAVIGTLDSAGARASIPLLNEAGFLHVSLGAGYRASRSGGEGEPERWYPPGGARSPASSATTARRRARSCARRARGGSWSRPRAATDARVARAPRCGAAARAAGARLAETPGPRGAVIYAGADPVSAAGVAESVARETPGARVVLPDEIVRAGTEGLHPRRAAARRPCSSRARPRPGSTPELRAFEAAFERAYGRGPGPTRRSGTPR